MSIILVFNSLSEPYEDVFAPVPPEVPEVPASGEFEVGTDTYIVVEGDTLEGIAQRFNTTVEELRALNGLNSNFIYVGQQLKVSVDGTEDAEDEANEGSEDGDYENVM